MRRVLGEEPPGRGQSGGQSVGSVRDQSADCNVECLKERVVTPQRVVAPQASPFTFFSRCRCRSFQWCLHDLGECGRAHVELLGNAPIRSPALKTEQKMSFGTPVFPIGHFRLVASGCSMVAVRRNEFSRQKNGDGRTRRTEAALHFEGAAARSGAGMGGGWVSSA